MRGCGPVRCFTEVRRSWADDEAPLDAEWKALPHADLAGFAEQAERVLAVPAVSGGWTGLAAEHRRTDR